ncbi:MAG: FAD-dependent thymidylate synthase [Planctomycetota bacterium]|nr:FAD-dependent thymidylate synthase [Planctomycetota bacterium]
MRVLLLKHTEEPEATVAAAARLCYSASDVETLLKKLSKEKIRTLVRDLIKRGHHSAVEHASFTFVVEGISRACTHQLVRHRIASYSQQSQRYVSMESKKQGGQFPYIIPETVKESGLEEWFAEKMRTVQIWYDELCAKLETSLKIKGEDVYQDARYILPNAAATRIMFTMNARELLHFFTLRCCNRAQWEIRKMAIEMLKSVKKIAPSLFEDAGPACLRGHCPEGEFSCGKADEMRMFFKEIEKNLGG